MVEANLRIIEELKYFLKVLCTDSEMRRLVTFEENDFSRQRKLTLERIAAIILNMPKRSLSIEIQEFFEHIGKGGKSCTKGAFSLQRSKLNPLFFKVWNQWLVGQFYQVYRNKVKRWQGFRIQAVDGSTAYLVDTEDVKAHFGVQEHSRGGTPMARVMQIHDILNDLTVWGDLYPIKVSEPAIIATQIYRLGDDSITLFDRCFPGYGLMYLMLNQESPSHFVIRCATNFNKEVIEFVRSRKHSKVIELRPTTKAIAMLRDHRYIVSANTTIKVRMVKINLPTGEKEILLTSLYDEKIFSLADLKHLYGLRWGIETAFNKEKNQQQLEQFSGIRAICIQQDYAATLFVANVQSLIEKQSEQYLERVNQRRKYDYKINRNISWASLKYNIVDLFLSEGSHSMLLKLQEKFERYLEPVRPGRKYERHKKARRTTGKYQTLTNYKRAV